MERAAITCESELFMNSPITRETYAVGGKARGGGIGFELILFYAGRGDDVTESPVSKIGFGGASVVLVGGHTNKVSRGSFAKKDLDKAFGFVVRAFAEVGITEVPLFVDEVFGWPVVIVVSTPDSKVVVLDNGICKVKIFDSASEIGERFLEFEFWGVNADNDKPGRMVLVVPGS